MALIKWNNKYSVDVEEIDYQHKKLFKLINMLDKKVGIKENENVVSDVLRELHKYLDCHFKTEEYYFDKFNYSESISHKDDHKGFIQKMFAFEDLYKEDRMTLPDRMVMFLMEWLMTHILIEDRKYIKCFKENGLK